MLRTSAILILLIVCLSPDLQADGFGWDAQGGVSASIEDYIFGGIYTPSSTGTLDSVKAYILCNGADKYIKCAIYDWTDSTIVDSTDSVLAGAKASADTIYFDFLLNATVYADTSYLIAVWGDPGGGDIKLYFSLSGGDCRFKNVSYGAWPGTLDGATSEFYHMSIYAYYTPAVEAAGQVIIIQH